ncbi:hypothetical protein M446_6180 [Methylobacterium sp. 4-46]|uniref:hypothetical protein n=1 Tax=unclassified Methylobacterium TaxID=2615210 RepID=UPI000165CDE9|nr:MULTISPECIES: hypothetical protein [Methylobacterium]ACA20449.1 hypothetical protein M446_6180 [Methylobacterium sp. 4-46]WFT79619.1 hypothetical protein QA634_31190 [Methylobacterium nodulans]
MTPPRRDPAGRVIRFPAPELGGRWAAPRPAGKAEDGGATVVLLGLLLVIGGSVLLVALQTLLILRTL